MYLVCESLRVENGDMSDHYLVEGKLRVDLRWVRARQVGSVKDAFN